MRSREPKSESSTLRVSAALTPLPFCTAFLIFFIRALLTTDVLERRIQDEALAVAY